MATNPQFAATPVINWATLITTNTAKDGTGTVSTVDTAATNGTFIRQLRARALGTNVASVLRIFVNNGSTNATPANNSLVFEQSLPATTLSEVAALIDITVPLNLTLPVGYKINVVVATNVGSVGAGWQITCEAGDL